MKGNSNRICSKNIAETERVDRREKVIGGTSGQAKPAMEIDLIPGVRRALDLAGASTSNFGEATAALTFPSCHAPAVALASGHTSLQGQTASRSAGALIHELPGLKRSILRAPVVLLTSASAALVLEPGGFIAHLPCRVLPHPSEFMPSSTPLWQTGLDLAEAISAPSNQNPPIEQVGNPIRIGYVKDPALLKGAPYV